MICPNLETCPFINDLDNKNDLNMYKNKFCNSQYEKCVRFILSNTTIEVPSDLVPDEVERLKEIMKN